MVRKVIRIVIAAAGLALLPTVASAALYSPTQAELSALVFADFIDNENPDFASLNTKTNVGLNAVAFNYTTDFDINDALWRVALENADFSLDMTPYDTFNISFSNPIVTTPGQTITAQIFVRTSPSEGLIASSSTVVVNPSATVSLSIPKSRIISLAGDPTQISSFGIEFFGGDEFDGTTFTATASTTPQPPPLEDHLLFSWETPNNPGTPVDDRFEGWTTLQGPYIPNEVPQPDHTHAIGTTGATHGTKSLQIDRLVTGLGPSDQPTTITFRWGSQISLDANAGGGGPAFGDYNDDDAVDAGDYTFWRNQLGQPATTLANRDPTNMATTVGESHYGDWRENYGNTAGGPNPVVLDQIQDIVALINDPDSYSIAFDVYFEDQFPNTNPGYLDFRLAIQAAEGTGNVWWETTQQFNLDMSPLANGQPAVGTAEFLLSQFDLAGVNGIQSLKADGLDPNTQYLKFNLSTNYPIDAAPVTYRVFIDNFRIRHIIPGGGGGVSGVPEPSSALLALVAAITGGTIFRRRQAD